MSGFNQLAFAAAVAAVISARSITDREAARQAGVASSTLTRCIRQDKCPDVHSLAKLADWAGLSVDVFVVRQRQIPETAFVVDQRRVVAAQRASEAAAQALAVLLGVDAR